MNLENETSTVSDTYWVVQGNMTTHVDGSAQYDIMTILESTIATIGIINNLIVVFAFLNDKKLRRKIPNIFIINQVSPYPEMVLNFHLIIQQMVQKYPELYNSCKSNPHQSFIQFHMKHNKILLVAR